MKDARTKYAENRKDIKVLIDCVRVSLDGHAREAEAEAGNWGFVGDLADARQDLKGLLMRFIVGRPGLETEIKASRWIEDHLAGLRI